MPASPQGLVEKAAPDQLLEARIAELEQRVEELRPHDSVSIVCFSGEWDRLYASFVLANGALALGQEVHLFFTFWGASALRSSVRTPESKSAIERMIGRMLPRGPKAARLSKLNWLGFGKAFFRWRMRRLGVDDLDRLVEQSVELGAEFHLCETSARLLGLSVEECSGFGPVDPCGVAAFLTQARKGRITLFV